MSFEEQMRFGEQMSFGQQISFEMSFGQQISFGQQMNFGEQMTSEERKEWETLCRMYHVDSLYEAIQGCRRSWSFSFAVPNGSNPVQRRNEKGQRPE